MPRNFKRLPGEKFTAVPKLDEEVDNLVKQLNLFSAEVVVKKTSKDVFKVTEFTKTLNFNASTAVLADTNNTLATVIEKLKESGII